MSFWLLYTWTIPIVLIAISAIYPNNIAYMLSLVAFVYLYGALLLSSFLMMLYANTLQNTTLISSLWATSILAQIDCNVWSEAQQRSNANCSYLTGNCRPRSGTSRQQQGYHGDWQARIAECFSAHQHSRRAERGKDGPPGSTDGGLHPSSASCSSPRASHTACGHAAALLQGDTSLSHTPYYWRTAVSVIESARGCSCSQTQVYRKTCMFSLWAGLYEAQCAGEASPLPHRGAAVSLHHLRSLFQNSEQPLQT